MCAIRSRERRGEERRKQRIETGTIERERIGSTFFCLSCLSRENDKRAGHNNGGEKAYQETPGKSVSSVPFLAGVWFLRIRVGPGSPQRDQGLWWTWRLDSETRLPCILYYYIYICMYVEMVQGGGKGTYRNEFRKSARRKRVVARARAFLLFFLLSFSFLTTTDPSTERARSGRMIGNTKERGRRGLYRVGHARFLPSLGHLSTAVRRCDPATMTHPTTQPCFLRGYPQQPP